MSSVFERVNDAAMRGFGREPSVRRLHLVNLQRDPLRGVNPQAGVGLDPGTVAAYLIVNPRLLGPGTLTSVVDLRPPTTAPPVGDLQTGLTPFDIATDYEITLDCTAYSGPKIFATLAIPPTPTTVTEAAQRLAALINAESSDPAAPRALAVDFYGRGVVDCVMITSYEDPDALMPTDPAYILDVVATGGAGAIAATMDCDEVSVRVYLRLRDASRALPFPMAFCGNPNLIVEEIEPSGYVERVDAAGFDALYPQIYDVVPNVGFGTGVEPHALILVALGQRETS
jgi:hypothetical protein